MKEMAPEEPQVSLLYVEDEALAREMVERMIARKFPHLKIHSAENGKQGVELYRKYRPEIVITDINMPIMDGIRMAGEIKALKPDAMIIVMTAYSDTEYMLNAIELGISRYVLKPVDHNKLSAAIEKCLATIALEERVRKQNDFIRKLFRAIEQSPSMAMITDVLGNIEYVNPKFTEVTGYTLQEIVGQNPRIMKSGATPPEVYEKLWNTLNSGNEWHGEFLNRKKSGELFWESASISPLYNDAGVITHFVAVKEDITARKRAEEEIEVLNTNLADQVFELQLASQELEAFNYSVSHDLRAPLTNISGYCQVLLHIHSQKLDKDCIEFVEKMLGETVRMNQLINTLLEFSRLGKAELERESVDLSAMATAIGVGLKLSDTQRQADFRIEEGITVNGDKKLMRVLLENLLGNAWKYAGKKAETVIEFGRMQAGRKDICFVRDNGAGFDMNNADRLFAPFQRLHDKRDFEGFGIGLATAQRIIQRHGGRIWAEGKEGEGATFYFSIN